MAKNTLKQCWGQFQKLKMPISKHQFQKTLLVFKKPKNLLLMTDIGILKAKIRSI